MPGKVIPVTPARALPGVRSLIVPVRLDLPDYGDPGNHFGGPWAKTKSYTPAGIGSDIFGGEDGASGPDRCNPIQGVSFNMGFGPVASGANSAKASNRIGGPWVLKHVVVTSDAIMADQVLINLFSTDSADLSLSPNIVGTNINGGLIGNPNAVKSGVPYLDFYPGFIEPQANKFLVCVVDNQSSVAARSIVVIFSMDLLG